jgi:hypothetical protein
LRAYTSDQRLAYLLTDGKRQNWIAEFGVADRIRGQRFWRQRLEGTISRPAKSQDRRPQRAPVLGPFLCWLPGNPVLINPQTGTVSKKSNAG